MARAIELSKQGFPAPNPHVGCVVVRNGTIIGEGFHRFAGSLHAESEALQGIDAASSDVFVTLEPCNHYGRQPPCSLALIQAKVARVVIAMPDPNPKAVGGIARLREAGIEVDVGLMQEEAAAANHQFLFAHRMKRPLIIAKSAISLDGRIALPSGESKWITGTPARAEGHRLRAELGAVLVGRATVEKDDPQLTARMEGVINQPLRIILDPSAKLTGTERVFDDSAETMHVTGQIDLAELASRLFARGITGVLIEGGARTIGGFLRAGLLDGLELFIAPKVLGQGTAWVDEPLAEHLADALSFEFVDHRSVGSDLWISARRPDHLSTTKSP
jgi:diaminohydroxyphosphoribosylaminopyrimidine deaminase/5-amino-6-(5-phosphoribosylamino)uracil reductase